MNLTIDESIKKILPHFGVIAYHMVFEDGYLACGKTKKVDTLFEEIYQTYPKKYDYENITKIEKLKETRDGYKAFGKDPSHTRPACEALLRRVVKGNTLYRLGDVIDLGNILSMETLRSVCVVDSGKLVGDITIRLGKADDCYEGLGRGIINVENIPVYCDEVSPFGCPTSDNERTSVKVDTKECLVMIICFDDTYKKEDEQKLIDLYSNYTHILHMEKIGEK